MISYLKGIVLFNELGKKRFVKLKQGVNIITGESKTGKSALIEIIDYCLCSSRSTIPKGIITDFGYLYSILLVIDKNCYVIARQSWEQGGKMCIVKEPLEFDVESLDYSYFKERVFMNVKDIQYKLEYALGLQVSNTKIEEEGKSSKKASLRNMVSYMFQHQNLMASKFALFYRFSDFYKRKDIIEEFPVFAGVIGQEYYSSLLRLNKLKSDLGKLVKLENKNTEISQRVKDSLTPLMKNYYSLLNLDFDDSLSLKKIQRLARNLPSINYEDIATSEGIVDRHKQLNENLEELRTQEREIILNINNLNDTDKLGGSFIVQLNELQEKTELSKPLLEVYYCPLCNNECKDIEHLNSEILQASRWLENEIDTTSNYKEHFIEDIRKLQSKKDEVSKNIRKVYRQVKQIESKYFQSDSLNTLQEKLSDAKAKILFFVDTINEGLFKDETDEIDELKSSIALLEERISGFDVKNKMIKLQGNLSANMNKLANGLDFEEEFKPIDLNFGLVDKTFDLYHNQKQEEKIFLYEMGSGANWVSCHIALFLSFLRLFTEQKEKSPMPLIQFYDQPSQVYFPRGMGKESTEKDESFSVSTKKTDIDAVNNMYKTIFNEVKSIHSDTGILPQIIIVDHVDGEELEVKDSFELYTRHNWMKGDALI